MEERDVVRSDEELEQPTQSDRRPATLVSSLGGFSESVYKGIRSLHDLLTAIQPLNLDVFEGSGFQETAQVGEGASYRVRKCIHRPSKRVVAMKRVKLPAKSAGLDAFHGRVACVLRDIEVMSHPPLAECKHIMGLQGYGWRLGPESIPFLITEYAQYGTLRQFLLAHQSSLFGSERLQLCRDISTGLEELHLAGVAHGDLKLDNILVFARLVDTHGSNDEIQQLPITIKLADFGYSLLLHHEDQNGDEQKYNGTELYNAPELNQRSRIVWSTINFRKCDIWALGLTCWEIMLDGHPYYEDPRVRNFLENHSHSSSYNSENESPNPNKDEYPRSDGIKWNLKAVQTSLATLVDDFAATRLRCIIPGMLSRKLLRVLLTGALKADPGERAGEVGCLPLKFGACTDLLVPRRQLAETAAKLSEWTFQNFCPTHLMNIPHAAKEQMVHDFKHVARSPGKSDDACKASFQVALASCVGFGVDRNLEDFGTWIEQSAKQGLKIGSVVLFWHERHSRKGQSESEVISSYQQLFRDGVRSATRHIDIIGTDEQRAKFNIIWNTDDVSEMITISYSKAMLNQLSKAAVVQCLQNMFMLNSNDVKKLVQILKIYFLDGTIPQWENFSSAKENYGVLDPQLPLETFGIPLLDAIAAASLPAVEGLLELGVSPFANYGADEPSILTALELATSLHLYQIVKIFAGKYAQILSANPSSLSKRIQKQDRILDQKYVTMRIIQALSASSILHRYLIHGVHAASVQEKMVHYFLYEPGPFQLKPQSTEQSSLKVLESAIFNGDFDLAQTWLKLGDSSNPIHPSIWNAADKANLILAIVDVACREIVSWNTGIILLEDVIRIGCSLDAEVPGLSLLQPIHLIIDKHQDSLFNWMVQQPFNPNSKDPEGRTCLHHLLTSGFSSMDRLRTLLDLGALPYVPDKLGVTPMHVATENDRKDELEEMLRRHPNIPSDDLGDTIFHYIARAGNVALMECLGPFLASSVNLANNCGRSPLLVAAALGTPHTIKSFLDLGADATVCDNSGKSWLHAAGAAGNAETLATVIGLLGPQLATSLASCDHNGDSALASTCRHFNERSKRERLTCCERLLAAGSSPEIPLHIAVEKGDPQLVALILKYNPQPQHECASYDLTWLNTTCLSKAAFFHNQPIVELLLKVPGATQVDSNRRSSLEYALLGDVKSLQQGPVLETPEYVQLLTILDRAPRSADLDLKDVTHVVGYRAFHIAILTNQLLSASLLRFFQTPDKNSFRSNINTKGIHGHTALQIAVATGKAKQDLVHHMLQYFMGSAADDVVDKVQTEIHMDTVSKKLVCRLVSAGADAFQSTKDCGSPIDLINANHSMHGRSYFSALMLLHSNKTSIAARLTPSQSLELSEILTNAACKSVWGDSRPASSAFALWIKRNDTLIDLWSKFTSGLTCKTFVDLLYAAGEPLAYSGPRSLRSALSKVLASKSPNVPLAICLLILHSEALVNCRTNRVANHLQVNLEHIHQITEREHLEILGSALHRAWEQNHWDLIEVFIRLGLFVRDFHLPQGKLASMFHHALKNNRRSLANILAGETIQWQRALYAEKSIPKEILGSLTQSSDVRSATWIVEANLSWKMCKTFDHRFQELFPDVSVASIRLYKTIDEDIEDRFRLHIELIPPEGKLSQSIERQRFLRALLEELFSILVQSQKLSSKKAISRLINTTLRLGAGEEKKPLSQDQKSLVLEPYTEGARKGLGIWIAHSSSNEQPKASQVIPFAKYTPGMLFYVHYPNAELVTVGWPEGLPPMWTAVHIHSASKELVRIPAEHFEQENSCLRWTDRPL